MGQGSSTDALSEIAAQKFEKEKNVALIAVLKGCQVAQKAAQTLITEESINKKDQSPVTVADFSVQAVVISFLKEHFPNDPIVAEEKAQDLIEKNLKDRVVELTNSVMEEPLTPEQVLAAIDSGAHQGGATGRFWALDPIDGTKGYLRKEQYAVCLALIENGKPVLGVLGCPNLPADLKDPAGKKGSLYWAIEGRGAYTRAFDEEAFQKISTANTIDPKETAFLESVEAGHSSQTQSKEIGDLLSITAPPVRMDSQVKYAALSRGDASIYLRLPVSQTYEEKIWDHAAGALIVQEAGGQVTDVTGAALDFSQGRTLAKNKGVIATSSHALQTKVLAAAKEVLFPTLTNFDIVIKGSSPPSAEELQKAIAAGLNVDPSKIKVQLSQL